MNILIKLTSIVSIVIAPFIPGVSPLGISSNDQNDGVQEKVVMFEEKVSEPIEVMSVN